MDLGRRDAERHDSWPGLILVLVGALLAVHGALRPTRVMTVEGDRAREPQLVKAFASGGLQYPDRLPPPEPPRPTGDPVADAAALTRWDQEQLGARPLSGKVRVDPGAKTPCPT